MKKYVDGTLPVALHSTWATNQERRGAAEHLVNLRNDHDLYIPMARSNIASRMPLTDFPKSWNNFEDESIKYELNPTIFKRNLKLFYLNKLNVTPNCIRANCPACNSN